MLTLMRYLIESQLRHLKETRRPSNYYLQTKIIVNTLKFCDILETYRPYVKRIIAIGMRGSC